MQRLRLLAVATLLAGALGACASRDQATWDYIQSGHGDRQRDASQPAGPPPTGQPQPANSAPMMGRPVEAGVPIPMTTPLLPRGAAPAPRVAGLGFLTGRWIAINPNKTVNEEIWSPPRGNFLIGSFRQIETDGSCKFVELSQIAMDGDELVLRLRHMQGALEVPAERNQPALFRLVSLTKDRVEFAGATANEGITSLVYERVSPTELQQSLEFAPESGQEAFVTLYTLDR